MYILNISSYEAEIEVTVESNKNTNKYVVEQTYKKDGSAKQVVLEPSNISGIKIIKKGKKRIEKKKKKQPEIQDK